MSDKRSSTYKTDYAGHERAYQKLQARGQKGWSTDVDDNDSKRAWARAILAGQGAVSSRILFLGCGAGEFVIDAARAGAEAHGIDIAPTAIEMARADASEADVVCTFVVGSVLDLPYPEQSMDLVVDDHCLHCIIGDDRPRFLSEAKRMLRPGGLLLVRSMCSIPKGTNVDPVTGCAVVNGIATRYFGSVDGLLAEVYAAGFAIRAHRVQPSEAEGSDMLEIEAVNEMR